MSDPLSLNQMADAMVRDALDKGLSIHDLIRIIEKAAITECLTRTRGMILPAASLLGLNRMTIYPRLKDYNISVKDIKARTKKRR